MIAQYFIVGRDKLTGKVRQVFNPDYEFELSRFKTDETVERVTIHRKEDWGVPLEPNSMTFAKVAEICAALESGSNR